MIKFIAGFAVFNSTTSSERLALGMSNQLNYTIYDTGYLDYGGMSYGKICLGFALILMLTVT